MAAVNALSEGALHICTYVLYVYRGSVEGLEKKCKIRMLQGIADTAATYEWHSEFLLCQIMQFFANFIPRAKLEKNSLE